MGLEDLPGGFRGGRYDGRDTAEADEHDGAIPSGEFPQRLMRQMAELVEVAYDGEWWRPWREVLLFVIEVFH